MLSNKEKDILQAIKGFFTKAQKDYDNTRKCLVELEGYSADEISQTIQKVLQQLDVLEPVRVENRNLESKLETALQYIDMLKERYKWIDVNDSLPSEEEWVLVSLARGGTDVLRLVNIEKFEKERNVKIGNSENFTYFWDKQTYWFKFNEVVAWKKVTPFKRKEQE